jgi:hypothetical protein
MNANKFIFKTLFVENKRDKYRYETYKVDKNKLNKYGKYLNKDVVSKLNVNISYTFKDIYNLFEKDIPEYKNLFEYLAIRDVFNNYTEWIILLKKVFNKLHVTDPTYLIKTTPIGVYLDIKVEDIKENSEESEENSEENSNDSLEGISIKKSESEGEESDEESEEESEGDDNTENSNEVSNKKLEEISDVIFDIFSEIGIVIKDKTDKHINPSMFEVFGINESNIKTIKKSAKIIKDKTDIDFNEFFPGKSNGRIVRYLKIYKALPNKTNYEKNDFKKELIDTGFVEVKGSVVYYIKEHLEDLKKWVASKILE